MPTQANARAHVWTFYGSVPFLRKHWSSTEELHFYGTATAYTTEELDFYGTSSRLFPQNSYFSEERSQIYKERLQNSKERCSILKITVVFLQNDTTFSSRSVVPCGPPYLSYHTIYPKNIAQFLIFYHTLSDGLTRLERRVGYNHLISNKREWNNCFIKNAHKYREFFPTFFVKTADFQLVLNFVQMRTVTI